MQVCTQTRRPRPCQLQRAVHQPAPGAGADQLRRHPKEGEFALTGLAKIQFEQTLIAPLVHQRMDIDHRRANDRCQFRIRRLQPRKPQPFLADAAIEIPKPVVCSFRRPKKRRIRGLLSELLIPSARYSCNARGVDPNTRVDAMRFSKFFGLNQSQAQLDFVDIDTDRDMRLFVDPYAIQTKENEFNLGCTDQIKTFFDEVLDALRKKNYAKAQELTAYLSEPQETFLGFSKDRPQGRGVGRMQADQILSALRNSRAFKTGLLADLAETELFIEGIGPDKISDLTTNVIRGTLIEYTQNQCNLHGIQMREGVPSNQMWHASRREWRQGYVDLPIVDNKAVILIPKYLVRWRLSLDSQEFYNHYMLSFLRDVQLNSGGKLVRLLKNKSRVVY